MSDKACHNMISVNDLTYSTLFCDKVFGSDLWYSHATLESCNVMGWISQVWAITPSIFHYEVLKSVHPNFSFKILISMGVVRTHRRALPFHTPLSVNEFRYLLIGNPGLSHQRDRQPHKIELNCHGDPSTTFSTHMPNHLTTIFGSHETISSNGLGNYKTVKPFWHITHHDLHGGWACHHGLNLEFQSQFCSCI